MLFWFSLWLCLRLGLGLGPKGREGRCRRKDLVVHVGVGLGVVRMLVSHGHSCAKGSIAEVMVMVVFAEGRNWIYKRKTTSLAAIPTGLIPLARSAQPGASLTTYIDHIFC